VETILDRRGSVEGLLDALHQMENNDKVLGILVLACDANEFKKEELDEPLRKIKKPLIGGVFPQILADCEKLEKGTLVVGLKQSITVGIIEGLSDSTQDMDEKCEGLFEDNLMEGKTIFVFVDGLSKGIAALNEAMFNTWGIESNFIGGGAGSLSFQKKPCIFSNKGLLEDAAILANTDIKSGIGVAHGWKPISEPLKVTEVDRNVIYSINWRPAFTVYKEWVEKFSNKSFEETTFFDLAKSYPLGLSRVADEMVVRDPIAVEEGALICVGEIPENSFVQILNGSKESLLEGAAKAKSLAENAYMDAGQKPNLSKSTFFVDCISRVLFLESDFDEELALVYQDQTLFGALTLGEIANTGKEYLEFYNKTAVVGILEV
jgi:hypothetical protein